MNIFMTQFRRRYIIGGCGKRRRDVISFFSKTFDRERFIKELNETDDEGIQAIELFYSDSLEIDELERVNEVADDTLIRAEKLDNIWTVVYEDTSGCFK